MVDWFCQPKTDSLLSIRVETPPEKEPPPDIPPEPSFYLEPDRIAGLGKDPPTPEDELVTIFLSSMAGHIMKRCETQDCMKRIDIIKPPPGPPPAEVSEEEEDLPQEVREEKKALSPTKNYSKRKSKVGGPKASIVGPGGAGGEPHSKKINEREAFKTAVDDVADTEPEDVKGSPSHVPQQGTKSSRTSLKKSVEEKSHEEEEEAVAEEELSPETKKVRKHLGKSYASMEEIDAKFHSWRFRELDQMMDADFINNNRFEGRISRMLMEEFGKFTWKNGQTYKGTFKKGWCVGHGLIEWNANSIYEGEVHCNMRHGFGVKTYVDGGSRMYHAGYWKMGKKHGEGISVYGDGDWYDGNWDEGQKTGIGTRRYKNGAKYHGMWYKGMRHGKGTMIWPNNDVYMGEWYFGNMHGKGKYTWNSFRNERFLSPMQNVYTGEWSNNLRHGEGVLELMTGGIIRTRWYDGQKSGSADIICRNGDVLHMPDLFKQDRVNPVVRTASFVQKEKMVHRRRSITNDQNLVKMRFHNDEVAEALQISDTSLGEQNVNANLLSTPTVPINAPVHTMDYTNHIKKLFEIKCSSLLPLGPSDPQPPVIPQWEKKAIMWLEKKWLEKVIIRRMGELTKVYNFYSTILSDLNIPEFKFCMYRLALWLLMKHCGLAEAGITTIQLDKMVDFGYDPFDKVMMYEMINYLLVVSWLRYVPKRIRNPDIPGIIASCFDKFIEDVVINAPSQYDGSFHKFLKYVPFDALAGLYSSFEYPMRIEDLCARLLYVSGKDFEDRLPFTPPYYKYVLQGKNVVGPDGYIAYVPFEIPNFDINLLKLRPEEITAAELRVLGLIGIDNIVRCVKEAVPEAINPVNDELKSEYELSFNDFCDILVNLITLYLDMSEDFYRRLLDAEEKERTGQEPQWASDGAQMGAGAAKPGEGFAKRDESKGGTQRKSMKRKSMKRKSMK